MGVVDIIKIDLIHLVLTLVVFGCCTTDGVSECSMNDAR